MSVSRRTWSRRDLLGMPFGAYVSFTTARWALADQSDPPRLTGPSVDAVCRGLNASDPAHSIAWVAFVDDPEHRSRRELWRVVDRMEFDRQLERNYPQIVSGLTAGERVMAADLLNLAKERLTLLRPQPPNSNWFWYSDDWMRSAIALSCIARVGRVAPDITERFQAEHGKSDNVCTRVVSAHLSQTECNDLRNLGLPDDMSEPIWQRVVALLYGIRRCDWLGDGALKQIHSVSLEHALRPDSWHCGLFVLGALGERGRLWLQRLDRAVATDADNDNVAVSKFSFTMSHALAALAAGCDHGRALLEAACKLSKRSPGSDLVPPFLVVSERAVGLMSDHLAHEVAAVLLDAPIGLSAFSAMMVLVIAGPHAHGCVEPLLEFLRSNDLEIQRRRFAAVAIMFAIDGGSREAIEAHLAIEKDECVKKVLRNGLEHSTTLSRELCPGIGLRGDEIELIFDDGVRF